MTDYEKLKAFAEELNPGVDYKDNYGFYKWRGRIVISYYGIDGSHGIRHKEGGKSVFVKSYNLDIPLDQWINETREYWREKGLPSLQGKTEESPSLQETGINRFHNKIINYRLDREKDWIGLGCVEGGSLYILYNDKEENGEDNTNEYSGDHRGYKNSWRVGVIDNVELIGDTKQTGKLFEIPNTVVHLTTQEEYDEYIKLRVDCGWDKDKYENEYWYEYEEETCCDINRNYTYTEKSFYEDNNYLIITLQELKRKIGVEETVMPFKKMKIDMASEGVGETHWRVIRRFTKTNAVKPAKSIMNNIKNVAKRLLLSEPEKTYVKAGLMTIDKEWGSDAIETGREQMLADYMATKGFKDQMTNVAKAIIKESK